MTRTRSQQNNCHNTEEPPNSQHQGQPPQLEPTQMQTLMETLQSMQQQISWLTQRQQEQPVPQPTSPSARPAPQPTESRTNQHSAPEPSQPSRSRPSGTSAHTAQTTSPDAHPFSDFIMSIPLPDNFRLPIVEQYDGSTDPQEHLTMFNTSMLLAGTSDPIKCRAFPSTLKKAGLLWFSSLESGSVNDFAELSTRFLSHFSTSRSFQRTSACLINLRQEREETLKQYLSRFNREAIQIKDLNPAVAVHAITAGLRQSPFADSLAIKPPADLDDLLQRSVGYINMEEAASLRKQQAEPQLAIKREAGRPDQRPRGEGKRNRQTRDHFTTRPEDLSRYDTYTPLITRREKILKEVYNAGILSFPARRQDQEREDIDRSKCCEFHRCYGHNTDNCIALKDEIEEIIRAGHLGQYVQRRREKSYDRRKHDPRRRRTPSPDNGRPRQRTVEQRGEAQLPPDNQIRGVINTISGGFAGGGESSSARRRHLRAAQAVMSIGKDTPQPVIRSPPISFSDDDFQGQDRNHDDPMVISVIVANFLVKRVLVDQGSSADILYWETFKKLQVPENTIKPFAGNLVGFAGEKVDVKGSTELLTTFGRDPGARTVAVRYLLVDRHTPYNIIIGRPTLNSLGAIVSTPHLTMKFPVSAQEVGAVHADQIEARQCYIDSLRPTPANEPTRPKSPPAEQAPKKHRVSVTELDPREDFNDKRPRPDGHLKEVTLGDSPNHRVKIGANLPPDVQSNLVSLLNKNADLFAYSPSDMPGIDPSFISHKLSLDPRAKPVAQKRRKLGTEKQKAVNEEVKDSSTQDLSEKSTTPPG